MNNKTEKEILKIKKEIHIHLLYIPPKAERYVFIKLGRINIIPKRGRKNIIKVMIKVHKKYLRVFSADL